MVTSAPISSYKGVLRLLRSSLVIHRDPELALTVPRNAMHVQLFCSCNSVGEALTAVESLEITLKTDIYMAYTVGHPALLTCFCLPHVCFAAVAVALSLCMAPATGPEGVLLCMAHA